MVVIVTSFLGGTLQRTTRVSRILWYKKAAGRVVRRSQQSEPQITVLTAFSLFFSSYFLIVSVLSFPTLYSFIISHYKIPVKTEGGQNGLNW